MSELSKHSWSFFQVKPKSVMMLSCRKTTHNLWRIILNNSISTWPSCEPLCSDREATWKEGRVGLQLKWTSSVQLWRSNPNLEPDETSVEMIDFCSILFLFVQRCFCNGKNYTHSNSYRDSGGIKQNHFIPPPLLVVNAHSWLVIDGPVLVFLFVM